MGVLSNGAQRSDRFSEGSWRVARLDSVASRRYMLRTEICDTRNLPDRSTPKLALQWQRTDDDDDSLAAIVHDAQKLILVIMSRCCCDYDSATFSPRRTALATMAPRLCTDALF